MDIQQGFDLIVGGSAPPLLKEMASKGLMPFPPDRMLQVLAALSVDADQKIAGQALQSTVSLPRTLVLLAAGDRATESGVLGLLMRAFADETEMHRLLATNPSLPDDLFMLLCRSASPEVLEALARNQERLRRSYEAIAALLMNPVLPARLRGGLMEERDRHRGAMREPSSGGESEERIEAEVHFDEVLTHDFEREDATLHPQRKREVQEKRTASVFQMIKMMNAGQKLILAQKGNKEARYLLIRDSNKQVATKVLESPRLSDTEVEMFAKMTNVCAEVLRGIAGTKEWMAKYNIMRALVLNAKTPIDISLPMVGKLNTTDMGILAKNRNVPEILRTTSARIFRQRKGGH
jgi:hypothetical protein